MLVEAGISEKEEELVLAIEELGQYDRSADGRGPGVATAGLDNGRIADGIGKCGVPRGESRVDSRVVSLLGEQVRSCPLALEVFFAQGAMVFVGSGVGHQRDAHTGAMAEGRIEARRLDADGLHKFGRRI